MTPTSEAMPSAVGGYQMPIQQTQTIEMPTNIDYIEIRTKDAVVKIPNDLESIRRVKKILQFQEEELEAKQKSKK